MLKMQGWFLKFLDIKINDSSNGVYLPMGDFGEGANHNKLNTKKYYEKVNLLIDRAFGLDGDEETNVKSMLELIRDMLEKDMF